MPAAVGHGLQGSHMSLGTTQDSLVSDTADKISRASVLYRPCGHVQTATVTNKRGFSTSKHCRSVIDGLSSLSQQVCDCS